MKILFWDEDAESSSGLITTWYIEKEDESGVIAQEDSSGNTLQETA